MPAWKDIDIWLRQKRDGDVLEMHDIEAIKNSLRNILLTRPGGRRMLPQFASMIYQLLFEPMDEITARKLKDSIFESIQRWEDRVNVESLSVVPNYDTNTYSVDLLFTVKSANSEIYSFNQILEAQ